MSNQLAASQIEQLLSTTKIDKESCKNVDLTVGTISYLLEDHNNEKPVIGYINKLLKSSLIDEEVYMHLTKIAFSISEECLYENINFWIQRIVDHNRNETNSKRYNVILSLVELGKEYPDFNKLMLSSLLFQILDECMSIDVENVHGHASLMCLASCLEAYPTSCISKKKELESYLIQFLFSKIVNAKVLKNATLCFQKLQKIGPSGPNSINYSNNWKASFEKLGATLDYLYDIFFDDIDEFHKYEKSLLDPYVLPDFPKIISAREILYVLEKRLHNTCLFLRGMLENEFSTAKCITPQYILNIITRVLSLHICLGENTSDTMFHFSMLLLKNQVDILYLLRSLIAVLKLNLLPFSATISKLLLDCLTRTRNCNCFKYVAEYKETLYKVLEYWIKILKNSLNINIHDKVINEMLNDISSTTKEVTLTISNHNNISQKAKSKNIDAKIISSSAKRSDSAYHLRNSFQTKERICYQSLCCLAAMFNNVCLSLKEATVASLYNALIDAILSICNGKNVFPYNTSRVTLKLFEVLLTTLEYSKPPVSINLITNLLRGGEKTTNGLTSHMCAIYLNLLEKICQPGCPTWNFIHVTTSTLNVHKRSEIEKVCISNDFTNKKIENQSFQTINTEINNTTESNEYEIKDHESAGIYSDISMEEHTDDVSEQHNKIEEEEEEHSLLMLTSDDEDELKNKMLTSENPCSSAQSIQKDHFCEPECKKTKTSSEPDITEMLASFVDEVEMLNTADKV